MPKTYVSPAAQNINAQVPQTFANSDGTNVKTCYTAGTDDSNIKAIIVTSTDTSSKDIQFYLSDGTSNFILRRVTIPASSGNSTSALPVDCLSGIPGLPFDAQGNRILQLRRGFQLRANLVSAASTGTQINVIAIGEDY
jgi:hypothetical protein